MYVKEDVKELNLTVVPTTTEPVPQRAVLVLDFSSSMSGDKIRQLKSAVELFLEEFLKPDRKGDGTTGNEVVIIEYDKNIINGTPIGPSSNIGDLDISTHGTGKGTNIDLGLTVAYDYISSEKSTTVILMSDGEPYQYSDENGNVEDDSTTKAKDEAKASATTIKEAGINLFTIGFDMGRNGQQLMKEMATLSDACYSADDGYELEKAFQEISSAISITYDKDPIPYQTQNGVAEITSGFTAGQNVEIYTTPYVVNTTKTYKTYTWEEFIELKGYVTYDESNGELTFKLRDYITDEGISENTPITIRFVSDEIKSASRSVSNGIIRESMEALQSEEQYSELMQKLESADEEIQDEEQQPSNSTDGAEEEKEDLQEPNDVTEIKDEEQQPSNSTDTSEEGKEEIQEPNDVTEVENEEQQPSNSTDTSEEKQESSNDSNVANEDETETVETIEDTEKIEDNIVSSTTEIKEDTSNIGE